MDNYVSKDMMFFLKNEIGLDDSSIELGLKLCLKNKAPLPISYGVMEC